MTHFQLGATNTLTQFYNIRHSRLSSNIWSCLSVLYWPSTGRWGRMSIYLKWINPAYVLSSSVDKPWERSDMWSALTCPRPWLHCPAVQAKHSSSEKILDTHKILLLQKARVRKKITQKYPLIFLDTILTFIFFNHLFASVKGQLTRGEKYLKLGSIFLWTDT